MKKIILLGGILLLAAQMAGATDVYFRCDGTAGSGKVYLNSALTTPADKGNLVQYIAGSVAQPDPKGDNYLGTGNTKAGSNFIGDGTGGTAGTFYKYLPAFGKNTNAYARVWSQAAFTTGPNVRYGNSVPFYVGDSVTPVKFNIPNFYLQYIADAPPAPAVNVKPEEVGYDVAKVTFSGYSAEHEYGGIYVSYGTDADATNGNNGQPFFLSGKPAEYFFGSIIGGKPVVSGVKYYVKAAGSNNFGPSAYGAPVNFTTKAAPAGVVPKLYDLDIELNGVGADNADITLSWKAVNATAFAVWSSSSPTENFTILADNLTGISYDTSIPKNNGNTFFRVAPAGEFPIGAANIPQDKTPFSSATVSLHVYALAGQTFGINTLSFPLKTVKGINGANATLQALYDEMTAQGLAANVRILGKWDQITQKALGFKYNDATKAFDKMHAGDPADLASVNLGMDEPIQITAAKDCKLVVVGKR